MDKNWARVSYLVSKLITIQYFYKAISDKMCVLRKKDKYRKIRLLYIHARTEDRGKRKVL